jgi:hypothetical protein
VGGLPTSRTVNGFAIDPADPRRMYAATRDGLFASPDAGASWKLAAKGPKSLAAVTVNPRRSGEVYAATVEGMLYRSLDGGATWARQK